MKIPIVSIIGRPNVGKSTLFNRLAGRRIAITHDEAGTTRDRIFYRVDHPVMDYHMVDTAGIGFGKGSDDLETNVQRQTRVAIDESDLILFLVSHKESLTKEDLLVADLLRKKHGDKPVLLLINKCDDALTATEMADYYQLGLGDPIPISAMHFRGIKEMENEIIELFKKRHFITKASEEYASLRAAEQSHLNIALVGKPNVGKSSLINALLNQEKLVVSDVPGTTRDSIDSLIRFNGKEYNFIDTAGLRRHSKLSEMIEKWSVIRTFSSIERCDIAALVLDSSEVVTNQDQQIVHEILEANKGLILLANKWDIKVSETMEEEDRRATYIDYLQKKFPFVPWAPVIFVSAMTKKNLPMIFDQADQIRVEQERRIPTASLNRFLAQSMHEKMPAGAGTFPPKFYYLTQTDINPPRFALFINKKKYFHFSYLRYFENRLREKFGFNGTPIVFDLKEKTNPFDKGKKERLHKNRRKKKG